MELSRLTSGQIYTCCKILDPLLDNNLINLIYKIINDEAQKHWLYAWIPESGDFDTVIYENLDGQQIYCWCVSKNLNQSKYWGDTKIPLKFLGRVYKFIKSLRTYDGIMIKNDLDIIHYKSLRNIEPFIKSESLNLKKK